MIVSLLCQSARYAGGVYILTINISHRIKTMQCVCYFKILPFTKISIQKTLIFFWLSPRIFFKNAYQFQNIKFRTPVTNYKVGKRILAHGVIESLSRSLPIHLHTDGSKPWHLIIPFSRTFLYNTPDGFPSWIKGKRTRKPAENAPKVSFIIPA